MKKKITLLCINVFFIFMTQAQSVEWLSHFGGSSEDIVLSIATDNKGNTYSTGYFAETSNFDNITLTSLGFFNGFVTKTDANGNIIWAKLLAQPNDGDIDPYHSVIPKSISVDTNGNVIVGGYFGAGDFDADPGAGENILSSSNYEMFILKLDTDGDFIWANSFGSTIDSFESISDVGVDANGDIYVTGHFSDNINMNHAAGTSSITSYGYSDIFIMKYTSDGNFSWMQNMGGTISDLGISLDVTPSGDVYITGNYSNTATFYAPLFGSNPIVLTTTDGQGIFALKLDTFGSYQNVVKVGEASSNGIGMSIATDTNGYAYVTGYYSGILTANEGTSDLITIDADNSEEGFIAKVDFLNESVIWLKEIDGGSDSAYAFAVDTDSNNNIHLSGFYSSTLTVGQYNLTKQTTYALENYLITMNDAGDFIAAYQFGGVNTVDTQSLVVDVNDNILIAGSFRQTVDISPFSSEDLSVSSLGFRDNYILSIANNNLLSINTPQLGDNLKIYPNPSENIVYISNQQQLNELKYTLFDVSGKPILTGKLGMNNQINISHLKSGFYFLTLDQSEKTFKLLKR